MVFNIMFTGIVSLFFVPVSQFFSQFPSFSQSLVFEHKRDSDKATSLTCIFLFSQPMEFKIYR